MERSRGADGNGRRLHDPRFMHIFVSLSRASFNRPGLVVLPRVYLWETLSSCSWPLAAQRTSTWMTTRWCELVGCHGSPPTRTSLASSEDLTSPSKCLIKITGYYTRLYTLCNGQSSLYITNVTQTVWHCCFLFLIIFQCVHLHPFKIY